MYTINGLLLQIQNNVDPKKDFIITDDKIINCGTFIEDIYNLSAGFQRAGLQKGDVFALFLNDSPFRLEAVLAGVRAGGIFMGLSPKLPILTVCELIRKCDVKILLAERDFLYTLKAGLSNNIKLYTKEEIVEFSLNNCQNNYRETSVDAHDPCGILLTSGTTGFNKCALHSHENFLTVGKNCASAWQIKSYDKMMSMIPMMTGVTFGSLIMPALLQGATIIMPKSRKNYHAIFENNVSFLMGNPTNFQQMLDKTSKLDKTKGGRGTIAGSFIPAGLLEKTEKQTGYCLYPHYGMTELLAVTTAFENKENTVGKPFQGISLRIEDKYGNVVNDGTVGQIMCKSPTMFLGYKNETSTIRKGDWFNTGDLGYIKQDGNLVLTGRLKECIIRGGNNVFPEEIEGFANKLREVRDCAVVGIPHDKYGEAIALCIVLSPNTSINDTKIKNYLSGFLPPFKIPDTIVRIDEIPRTFNGKISRQKLKERLGYV